MVLKHLFFASFCIASSFADDRSVASVPSSLQDDTTKNDEHMMIEYLQQRSESIIIDSPPGRSSGTMNLHPCTAEELMGKTYFAKFSTTFAPNTCFKIDLFPGGSVEVDYENDECNASSFFTAYNTFGKYNRFSDNVIHFSTNSSTAPGSISSSQIVLMEDSTMLANDALELVSSIIDTSIPDTAVKFTLRFPTCESPSVSPSVPPTSIPTAKASSTPSLSVVPTTAHSVSPSVVPSSNPTMTPTCMVDDVVGKTYYTPYNVNFSRFCLKIEMFDGGHIFIDYTNPGCSKVFSTTPTVISGYESHSGSNAHFNTTSPSDGIMSGDIVIVEDPASASALSLKLSGYDSQSKTFSATMSFASCTSPSATPTIPPSASPSKTLSGMPSLSSHPSSMPTLNISTSPSSNPTATPTCSMSNLLGKSYLLPYQSGFANICIKVDFFDGGAITVDSANANCAQEYVAREKYSVFDRFSGNEAIFTSSDDDEDSRVVGGVYPWTATAALIQRSGLSGMELHVTKFDMKTQSLAFDLFVGVCEAPSTAPSAAPTITSKPSLSPTKMPSSEPSAQASLAPSTQRSAVPSSIPSMDPTVEPSLVPSSVPSQSPSVVPSTTPSDLPTLQCYDYPLNWHDSDTSAVFTCDWYGGKDNCAKYGDDFENMDKTANEACCVCGGGVSNASPSTAPSNIPSAEPSLSTVPSIEPSSTPSVVPSLIPSTVPSLVPSANPSLTPSIVPSLEPSSTPSVVPSLIPSTEPSLEPDIMTTWISVAGKGDLYEPSKSTEEFNALFAKSPNQIVHRRCLGCNDTHKDIYYRRYDANGLPANFDLLRILKNYWYDIDGNKFHTDFELYSSYDDALSNSNPWLFCNFNDRNVGFPRDCGPLGYIAGQWNIIESVIGTAGGGQSHVAFYVEGENNVVGSPRTTVLD